MFDVQYGFVCRQQGKRANLQPMKRQFAMTTMTAAVVALLCILCNSATAFPLPIPGGADDGQQKPSLSHNDAPKANGRYRLIEPKLKCSKSASKSSKAGKTSKAFKSSKKTSKVMVKSTKSAKKAKSSPPSESQLQPAILAQTEDPSTTSAPVSLEQSVSSPSTAKPSTPKITTTEATAEPTEKLPTSRPSSSHSVKPTNTPTFKPAMPFLTTAQPSVVSTFEPTSSSMVNSILSSHIEPLASDEQGAGAFGNAVGVSGDTVVIGASRNDFISGGCSGSAYIFALDGDRWKQQAHLIPGDGQGADCFGKSVAVSGDTVVIGAHRGSDNGRYSGSAYVFIRNGVTWKQQAKLLANDGQAGDLFGISVAVSENTLVIGAVGDDDNVGVNGSAYVFVRDGGKWKQQAKLLADEGQANDYIGSWSHSNFGWSVALSGNTAVIGSPLDINSRGSAYVFVREGSMWSQQLKLSPYDGQAHDQFGYAASVSGDTIVIGAEGDDDNGSSSGSAYVFIRDGSTWNQQAKLLPTDGQAGDNFGYAVAVSGDTVIIGAGWDDDNGDDSGSAYVFIRDGDTWKQRAKLLAIDGQADDRFGKAVGVSGDTSVIGAPNDADIVGRSGSVYVFMLQ